MKDGNTATAIQAAPRAHPSAFDKLQWVGELQARKDLTGSARRIIVRLAYHHNSTTGRCDPSVPGLAEGAGISERMAYKALDELKAAGIIDWVSGGEKDRNKYTLLDVPHRDFPSKAATVPVTSKRSKGPATVIPFPEPAESGQSKSEGDELQFRGVVNSSSGEGMNSSSPEPLKLQPQKETSVSSEGPSGDSGKQTASGSQKGTKAKFTPFPDDFTLTDGRIKMATSRGVLTAEVKGVFDHFREYHLAKGSRSPNWVAMWATWCRENTRQRKASEPKKASI